MIEPDPRVATLRERDRVYQELLALRSETSLTLLNPVNFARRSELLERYIEIRPALLRTGTPDSRRLFLKNEGKP